MSQINTNTIANELGTGGPDFVGMPSVGGDPIVESGSNSDGEWTRWADGTQQCYVLNLSSNKQTGRGSGAIFITDTLGPTIYPIPFIAIPYTSISAEANSATDGSRIRWTVSDGPAATTTSWQTFRVADTANETAYMTIKWFATGRWK